METAPDRSHSVLREAHLRDYWKIIWQGRWTILAVFIVTVGITAIWTFTQTPIYKSTAVLEIQPQARRVLSAGDASGLGAAGYGWFAEEKYHNTQVEIITSRDVATRAANVLDLQSYSAFSKYTDHYALVDAFRRRIRVEPRRDTGLLQVSMIGADPAEITQWVNAVADAYVDRNLDKARENVEVAMETIEAQMGELGGVLQEKEQQRLGSMQSSEIFDTEGQEEIIRQQLQKYNSELTDVNIELGRLEDTLRQVREMRDRGLDLLAISELAENEGLRDLVRDRIELERDLESAKVELRPEHPQYEKMEKQLKGVNGRINDRIDLLLGSMVGRHEMALHRSEYLLQEIQKAGQRSLDLARAKSRSKYAIFESESQTVKDVFDLIATAMNEVQVSAQLMTNNVSVLDVAVPPRQPIKPRKQVNLMIGAMFGMFFGLAAVFFLDYLDNTIRTPEDVEKFLGLSVLSVVPKMQEDARAQRAVHEAYQSLRTSIIFSSKNRTRRIILVTSTGPREGKSSTVANLGRTLAASGDRVVIIDCDLRRPKQHVHHGAERDPGLTNFLAAPTEETDWTPYAKTLSPANLLLLSSGPPPPSPPDLLGNTRFSGLLEAMKEQYDWILIDSPPAASLADSALLASLSDMVVFVVHHNRTDRDHVIKTVQNVRAVNADIAGVVLNNVDIERTYRGDYYYAGYYYQQDETTGKTSRKKGDVERKAKVS